MSSALKTSRLHILFVCGRNQRRSPAAEALYRDDPRLEVRSAGVSDSARRRVTRGDLEWADVVMVMEKKQRQRLEKAFAWETLPPFWNLEIPDDYAFMDEELQDLLRGGVETWLAEKKSSPLN